MRLALVKFEPSALRGEVSIDAPAGATPLVARVDERRGDGELIVSVPDGSKGTELLPLLFLWEDPANEAGGDVAGWRSLGSWNYRSGAWQHCFARVGAPAGSKGKRDRWSPESTAAAMAGEKLRPGGLTTPPAASVSAGVAPDSSRSEATG